MQANVMQVKKKGSSQMPHFLVFGKTKLMGFCAAWVAGVKSVPRSPSARDRGHPPPPRSYRIGCASCCHRFRLGGRFEPELSRLLRRGKVAWVRAFPGPQKRGTRGHSQLDKIPLD